MTASDAGAFDTSLAKALSHPLRAHILMILSDRVASPNEISRIVEAPLPNVAYHVKTLRELGWIEQVRTVQRRGFIEHFYRALERPFFDDADWASLPKQARGAIAAITLRTIWDEVRASLDSGRFEARPDRYLLRAPLELDEQGWRELNELAARFFAEAEELAGRSDERSGGGERIRTRLVVLHFEMPDSEES